MLLKSYSKINLSLTVNSKPKYRLHEIQSLYCWINLFDKIRIKKIQKNKDKIIFKGPFAKFINSKDNSVYNLLVKLRELNLISNYYSIIVTKNIPVFGGLGGGTSNAAFILKYLLKNQISKISINKFEKLIGSDFKLFFKKQGFLKDLKTVVELKKKHSFYFLLIQPKIKCSTGEIYAKVTKIYKKEKFRTTLIKSRNNFLTYLSKGKNDLQFIVEKKYPFIKKLLKDINNEKGCCFSRMTGSGSVCYGLFKDQAAAKKALKRLRDKYPKFWLSLAKTV